MHSLLHALYRSPGTTRRNPVIRESSVMNHFIIIIIYSHVNQYKTSLNQDDCISNYWRIKKILRDMNKIK